MTKLIILDRDGVINQDSMQYIKSVNEFKLLPGSVRAIAMLSKAGYRIGVATNQSGIARGYYDKAQLEAIHEKMITHVREAGGSIDIIEYCPHMPDYGCTCRKPSPGMLIAIAKHFNEKLLGVPFVGDRISDIQAAETVGAKPLLVLSNMTDRIGLNAYPHVPVFNSLLECVETYLLTHDA
ncbi:D-glycero-beta-D-manno-heptose 1,7-bisphosphate 7-phosphatase [Legionella impletisoli]|uniref:D,D-heptose 1,7-bisphosphate phosphatase n=1 Tax=Legionella impletisoli TaxID=343510 RepID=A0A917N918_9GAMM|nr:D-glycero-beta-D-manno-heptose 1,7-bisphosphate 7-phosphatase [Legionella impletisoli]GGI79144.1 D,D-heptose 1,7-bisphosphate phosphatase [Legionella impletisoli]